MLVTTSAVLDSAAASHHAKLPAGLVCSRQDMHPM